MKGHCQVEVTTTDRRLLGQYSRTRRVCQRGDERDDDTAGAVAPDCQDSGLSLCVVARVDGRSKVLSSSLYMAQLLTSLWPLLCIKHKLAYVDAGDPVTPCERPLVGNQTPCLRDV